MSFNKTMTRSGALAAALLAGAALAGCAGTHPPPGPVALTPTEQYGVKVTSAPEQIALGLHAGGLTRRPSRPRSASSSAAGATTAAARSACARPSTPADPAAARRMQDEASAYVIRLGVPAERLQVAGYVSNHAPAAPLLASYDRFEAHGPNCSGAWGSLTSTGKNGVYDHFGCSVTANFAAQVANPRDFLAPQVETPADDVRREVVLDKYRRGETTASAKDDQANGKVSDSSPQ